MHKDADQVLVFPLLLLSAVRSHCSYTKLLAQDEAVLAQYHTQACGQGTFQFLYLFMWSIFWWFYLLHRRSSLPRHRYFLFLSLDVSAAPTPGTGMWSIRMTVVRTIVTQQSECCWIGARDLNERWPCPSSRRVMKALSHVAAFTLLLIMNSIQHVKIWWASCSERQRRLPT